MSEIFKPTRRGLITGLASLLVAPAIVRVENLMPVKPVKIFHPVDMIIGYDPAIGRDLMIWTRTVYDPYTDTIKTEIIKGDQFYQSEQFGVVHVQSS